MQVTFRAIKNNKYNLPTDKELVGDYADSTLAYNNQTIETNQTEYIHLKNK